MVKEFIDLWERNKGKLRERLECMRESDIGDYKDLVVLVVDYILNGEEEDSRCAFEWDKFNSKKITVIDDGDYQGMQLFIIPRKTYQPGISDYIYTHNYYGSCSGCDELLAIINYGSNILSEVQVNDLMTLCLHLVQRMCFFKEED